MEVVDWVVAEVVPSVAEVSVSVVGMVGLCLVMVVSTNTADSLVIRGSVSDCVVTAAGVVRGCVVVGASVVLGVCVVGVCVVVCIVVGVCVVGV